MFDQLTQYVSGSNWSYVYLLVVSAVDAIFPVVPSETSVILGGVLASSGDLSLLLVIVFSGLGAFIGDNTSYWIGRLAGGPIERRFFSGDRRARLVWAEDQIQRRGGYLILVARFIPGGRVAVTLGCGMLHYPWRRFLPFDAAASAIWACYAALLGYVGGRAFERQPWKGFLVAFAVALGITGIVELVRWVRKRRAQPAEG